MEMKKFMQTEEEGLKMIRTSSLRLHYLQWPIDMNFWDQDKE